MAPTSRAITETNQYHVDTQRHHYFYQKGERIPLMLGGIWQICKGLVRLTTLYPVGEECVLGWAGPSMCFSSYFSNLQTYQASVLSSVSLMCYTMLEVETRPKLAQELFPQLGKLFKQTEALLAIAGLRRVEDRLHQLLLLLKEEFGEPVPNGTRLNIRLTHQDIAAAIGTTRVTITRLLGKFKQQEWLSTDKSNFLILKKEIFPNSSDLFRFDSNTNINYQN
ncbi:MAG: Crp/Fnr family transcriptional regulator [Trichodesmium sp. St16_bin4-tuft]|nr:Crp/Fnr family transcriptional regulator [Trichodesmium sp. St4_bin8_1]MDE5070932.1 Crp/Fnr family transcriptional regulator [Trichodesmium sp. St5_bin8]MDE5077617.1 Crp/Fnr family transcriptional regulator [Trichodesmium sp. St2_bin6]MDE5098937.1 Crp/Fnr family transcriptional regulator [Trichodesmium sp. St16_bin4-tuft]MDE5105225.1 Crp/Fnr family transcriptional regulator [Trichodesmium sp. St19_bin2]